MTRHSKLLIVGICAASLLVLAGGARAGEPTCSQLGIETHGQHIIGDYVTALGGIGGGLVWPPAGGVVGAAIAAIGAMLPGGPGPGFHFPNGFAPGASFCKSNSKSPGTHL